MSKTYVVSESVCAGHPDKLADQISDAILDAALAQDSNSRVAAETLVAPDTVVLAGEISTSANLDYDSIVRSVVADNGYTNPKWGFSNKSKIINKIHKQSAEIAVGVDNDGAGDQGLMYGYATNETEEYLPTQLVMAHRIVKELDNYRKSGIISYLRPDGKSQVVLEKNDSTVLAIKHITVAVPHNEEVDLKTVKSDITKYILQPLADDYKLSLPKDIIVNGTGVWHTPGPVSDVGLTGRKIVVDTYGGAARVGGGAFSGKDPSKVDRSGAYAARYIAKNIVSNSYADKVEVCLAYYIGAKKPIIRTIETFGTAKVSEKVIAEYTDTLIDLSVKGIIKRFDLLRPVYLPTASYGHFGKPNLPWENVVS